MVPDFKMRPREYHKLVMSRAGARESTTSSFREQIHVVTKFKMFITLNIEKLKTSASNN